MRVPDRVRDALRERVVRPTEDFLRHFNHHLGVEIRRRKDERFREPREIGLAIGEELRINRVLVFLEHLADLVANEDAAVELFAPERATGERRLHAAGVVLSGGDGEFVPSEISPPSSVSSVLMR